MNFRNRFSVGLPVLDSVEVFDRFLKEYSIFIENIYFSLPLGDRFHSRIVTQNVLRDARGVPFFLKLISCVKEHGLRLELLFNTAGLSTPDFVCAKEFCDANDIDPDEIGIRKEYFYDMKTLFPSKELVYSFNNFPSNREDYFSDNLPFDQYVIGRQFIRDSELLRQIKAHHAKAVLLLNNGCSFTCGGCRSGNHCHDAYFRERDYHSAEYMYARQSIFPFEIHEGYLNTDSIDLMKIASRNANVAYIRNCLDSYIHNDPATVEKDPQSYLLWSRLTWHTDIFSQLHYQKLREIKEAICREKDNISIYHDSKRVLALEIDLTDHFNLRHGQLSSDLMKTLLKDAFEKLHVSDNDTRLQRVYLGISSCEHLIQHIDIRTLCNNIRFLAENGICAALVLPPISACFEHMKGLLRVLDEAGCLPDEFVSNDETTFSYVHGRFDRPVALGRLFDLKDYTEVTEKMNCQSDSEERKCLFPKHLREFILKHHVPYLICDADAGGIWVADGEEFGVSVYPLKRVAKKNMFCSGAAQGCCDGSCMNSDTTSGKILYTTIPYTQDVHSMLIEKRCAFIVNPTEIM